MIDVTTGTGSRGFRTPAGEDGATMLVGVNGTSLVEDGFGGSTFERYRPSPEAETHHSYK